MWIQFLGQMDSPAASLTKSKGGVKMEILLLAWNGQDHLIPQNATVTISPMKRARIDSTFLQRIVVHAANLSPQKTR